MCNREMCEQFVAANGGSRGSCLFEGPTSHSFTSNTKHYSGETTYSPSYQPDNNYTFSPNTKHYSGENANE